MKKLVLGALCIVLGFAANAKTVQINGLYYFLDDSTKTAEVTSSSPAYSMTTVEIPASVTDEGKSYAVTSIGESAFDRCKSLESVSAPSVTSIGVQAFINCTALTSVYAPSVTSIGETAFRSCSSLTSLTVNSAMEADWDSNKIGYGLEFSALTVTFDPRSVPTLTPKQVVQAGYEVKEAVVETTVSVTVVADPSVTLKSNGQEISEEDYAKACEFYGIEQKTKPDVPSTPTAEDFKVVSKDAQVVKEGEIAVTKESLQAAKAETVQIANGVVYLGVSVLSNSDITASTAWAPVKFPAGTQIDISTDGTKLGIPVPVSAQSGFMILQSGNAVFNEFITQPGTPDTPSGSNLNPVDSDPAIHKMD